MKQSPKVVFFGSGPVAASCLTLLLKSFQVEAVITKPNPAHYRGRAPVLDLSEEIGLPYFTPADKTELTQLFTEKSFDSPAGIVIDYGIIIDQPVIDHFPRGIINSHFSLLPQWRGPDPITFSILSGQSDTGVSLMSIVSALDEGPLLAQEKISIQPKDTSVTLTQKLIRLSDDMLQRYMADYLSRKITSYSQTGEATYSRKLKKSDGIVDWLKPAEVIEREIRAYYLWPKSFAQIGPYKVLLRDGDVIKTSGKPGNYSKNKNELIVYCGQNALKINTLQPVNKVEMPVPAFLAGYPL